MEAPVLPKGIYRFGLFQLDADRGRLLREGLPIRLSGQPLQILCLLLQHAGEVVTREELQQALWPQGTYVEFDASLNAALKRLRLALRDDAENPRFIETVPRRGYRFIAPVECESPKTRSTAEGFKPSASDALLDNQQESKQQAKVKYWPWVPVAALVLVFSVGALFLFRRASLVPSERKVIAVLPFANEGAGPELDYLGYAIANELVNDLSHMHSVSVRPLTSSAGYTSQKVDPIRAGKELRVTEILAGGYLLENNTLHVNLELVDVARNEPIWRDDLVAPGQDLLALRAQLADRTVHGVLPILKLSSSGEIPRPNNERAFELYLHSVGFSRDPEPNLVAIENLEESVSLDGEYAPTWDELCHRYYIDYEYGNGGLVARAKAISACKRVSELDPDGTATVAPILAEEGNLFDAYDDAASLLRRRPDSSLSHYTMSYVLRYAGLLKEAAKECDAALGMDPGFWLFRSCATTYTLLGDYKQARKYIALDENTGFGKALRMEVEIRSGDSKSAFADSIAASQAGGVQYAEIVRACLGASPGPELNKALTRAETIVDADPRLQDSEGLYRYAVVLNYCGESDAAITRLREAINRNYCSYPAMESDPAFETIRRKQQFAELIKAGKQCQEKFLAHRQRPPQI